MKTQDVITEAVNFLVDKYGNQMLDVHLELDNSPDDIFFETLTNKLAEVFPDNFVLALNINPNAKSELLNLPLPPIAAGVVCRCDETTNSEPVFCPKHGKMNR